jgi:hypothetical protein
MLPAGVKSIPELELEKDIGNRIVKLAVLLGYLLKFINHELEPLYGRKVTLGERVEARKDLFINYKDVFFAIGVRNCIVHPEDCAKEYTQTEMIRAGQHLLRAVNQIGSHPDIPRDVVRDVFRRMYTIERPQYPPESVPQPSGPAPSATTVGPTVYYPNPPPAPAPAVIVQPPSSAFGIAVIFIGLVLVGVVGSFWLFNQTIKLPNPPTNHDNRGPVEERPPNSPRKRNQDENTEAPPPPLFTMIRLGKNRYEIKFPRSGSSYAPDIRPALEQSVTVRFADDSPTGNIYYGLGTRKFNLPETAINHALFPQQLTIYNASPMPGSPDVFTLLVNVRDPDWNN